MKFLRYGPSLWAPPSNKRRTKLRREKFNKRCGAYLIKYGMLGCTRA